MISKGHVVYRRDEIRPTPTQKFSLKPALAGNDLHCLAKTGSGKTLCFGIPIVANLQKQRISKNDSIDDEMRVLTKRLKKLTLNGLERQIHPDAIIIGENTLYQIIIQVWHFKHRLSSLCMSDDETVYALGQTFFSSKSERNSFIKIFLQILYKSAHIAAKKKETSLL